MKCFIINNTIAFEKEKCTKLKELSVEISEYEEMITHAILTNDKESLNMWRRALQTSKIAKRRIANS